MTDEDEIRFHIEMTERDMIAGGMSAEDAREAARRRFGDVDRVRRSLAQIHSRRIATALTFLALAAVTFMQRLLWYLPVYASLHQQQPYYVAETLKNLCEIAVCVIALVVMGRRAIRRELALDGRILTGLAFGLAAALPMFVGFAIAGRPAVDDWLAVLYLAIISPFAEELAMRGFAFRSLRRSGWPLWPAALACAIVSAVAHVEKGQTPIQVAGIFLIITLGAATFAWLIERWQSIWFPFALHAMMNLSWQVFDEGPTALGGWYAFVLQSATVLLAILITIRMTPSANKRMDPRSREGDERSGVVARPSLRFSV